MISKEISREPFWALDGDLVFRKLEAEKGGLSDNDALERQKIFGKNVLEEGKRVTKLSLFLAQFKNPLIFLLLIAGGVTIALGSFEDAGFILAAALINAILGFYQENKAEEALQKLKTYVHDRVRVFRNGNEQEVSIEDLVPGDVIHLSQGNRVPADCRIIYENDLSTDEAILTGESLPVKKHIDSVEKEAGIGDRRSMVFKGTLVVEGFGNALVCATGSETEIGKIAALLANSRTKEDTPLKRAIKKFSIRMSFFLVFFTAIVFIIGISRGISLFEMFLTSVAIIISAVPEGLPIAMTVILAIGVQRLAKRDGIVRRLLAAETLGNTTVVLTDKTGTLTEAKISFSKITAFTDARYGEEPLERFIFKLGLTNTDVVIENPESPADEWRLIGNHMEKALARAAADQGVLLPQVKEETEIIDYLPFTSLKKYSAALVRYRGETYISVLGAPEVLLSLSKTSEDTKHMILTTVGRMAESGERILALAVKPVPKAEGVLLREEKTIKGLEFVGAISFRDPVRHGVKEAIDYIRKAGILTVIVTGDHRGTALAVARELDIDIAPQNIINGPDLDAMSDEELREALPELRLVSRVSPAAKVRIARAFKERGDIVAMTGDGVNDAASLREADIGIAMGSGTDVAQDVSDLVLLDDNFKTIVAAIEEGKKIMQNIKKVIVYLLSDALQEIILIGGALFFGLPIPLNALQILWVNFFSDSFPAISIAFEDGETNLRSRRSDFRRSLLDPQMRFLIFVVGTISSIVIFTVYILLLRFGISVELAKTFTFAAFGTGTLFVLFSVKSLTKKIFTYSPFSNRYLVGSVLLGLIVMGVGLYVPFFQGLLGTTTLPPLWLVGVLGIGILNIVLIELTKWGFRVYEKRRG